MEILTEVGFIIHAFSASFWILTCFFLQAMSSNNYGADPMLRSFGISIGGQITHVEGRTLPAPRISTKSFFPCILPLSSWSMSEINYCKDYVISNLPLCWCYAAAESGKWRRLLSSWWKMEFQQQGIDFSMFFWLYSVLMTQAFRCQFNILLHKLVGQVQIERWAIVNFSAHRDIRSLCNNLIRYGKMKGLVSVFTNYIVKSLPTLTWSLFLNSLGYST